MKAIEMKYFILIILCLLCFGCIRLGEYKQSETERKVQEKQRKQEKLVQENKDIGVGYEIISNTFIGAHPLLNNRWMYKIVVDPTITRIQIRPLAEKIIRDITSMHKDVDEITLYFYSDRDFLDQAYNIAMVDWGYPENKGRINIKIIENFEQDIEQRSKSETLFGLTEQARREIFREIVIAEDKGWSAFPLPNAAIEEREKLQEKYKQKIRQKYNITKEIEEKITNEGDREKWPLPF